jgi:hypothetical protein
MKLVLNKVFISSALNPGVAQQGLLTAANVPGRYIIVITAISFMIPESFFAAFVRPSINCPSFADA